MGGKHGKYVYVKRRDGWFVKVRVFKNRDESNPDRYMVVGPRVKSPPLTYSVLEESDLPEEARARLYDV